MTTTEDKLKQQDCVPWREGVKPLQGEALKNHINTLPEGWEVFNESMLEKTFHFPDFVQALDFVNNLGAIAERQGHHPDIFLGYGKVTVDLWTHKIEGLHTNDFIMAAKIDALYP
jgi:4a-hydroxytetrahydrobiopterin dehydratase